MEERYAGAYECLTEVHFLQGDWNEGEQLLVRRFQLPSSEQNRAKSAYLPDLIASLFRSSTDPRAWTQRVGRVADIAEEAREEREKAKAWNEANPTSTPDEAAGRPDPIGMLGDVLVRSLARPAYAGASAEALDGWAEAWREAARRHPDLCWRCGCSGLDFGMCGRRMSGFCLTW